MSQKTEDEEELKTDPTKLFTISKPKSPPVGEFHLFKKRRCADFHWSGCEREIALR